MDAEQPATRLLLGESWRLDRRDGRGVATVEVEVLGWRLLRLERTGDEAAGAIADMQRGVISRPQGLAAGLGSDAIALRLRRKRWRPFRHRGVYLLGHENAPPGADEAAALLASPRLSVVSRASALHLAGLCERPSLVHVVTKSGSGSEQRGMRLHRTSSLDAEEVTLRYGPPTTTVLRALWDVASCGWRGSALEQVVGEAIANGHVDEELLRRSIEDAAGRHGVPALRDAMRLGGVAVDSRPERLVVEGLRKAGSPAFEVHGRVGPYKPDILFRELKIAVEVKGPHHRLASRFESDHEREQWLRDQGLAVLPFTTTKVRRDLPKVVGRIMREVGRAEGRRSRHDDGPPPAEAS